jgi:transposase
MSGYSQEKSFTVVAEARRKWTRAKKQAIVAEIAATSVSAVACKHGIASRLLFRWRRELGTGGKAAKRNNATAFVPMALPAPAVSPVASVPMVNGNVIEIELASGHRLRVDAAVDAEAFKRVIVVLAGR